MVDNPDPIERTGADPVTPDAVRARVGEVFDGIDLSTSGQHTRGLVDFSVSTYSSGLYAEASINGLRVADINTGEHGKNYSLYGRRNALTTIVVRTNVAPGYEASVDIVSTRLVPAAPGYHQVKEATVVDLAERVEIAQIVGIKV